MKVSENRNSKRIWWIDAVKGMAIILVVLGHVFTRTDFFAVERYLNVAIYSFHMPLFFLLSGMTNRYSDNFLVFLRKKSKSLLLPIPLFSLVFLLFKIVAILIEKRDIFFVIQYLKALISKENIINTLLCTSKSSFSIFWFLPVLFVAQLFVWGIIRISREWMRVLLMVLGVLVNIFLNRCGYGILPFGAGEALLAVPFIYTGVLAKKFLTDENNSNKRFFIILSFATGLIWVGSLFVWVKLGFGISDMYNSNINNPILFYLMGICGSVLTVTLFSKMQENKGIGWLSRLGKESLFVFGYHYGFLELLCVIVALCFAQWKLMIVKLLFDALAVILIVLGSVGVSFLGRVDRC